MQQIRHAVFETNSSSTHSISISRNMKTLDFLPVEDGVVTIYGMEFGWDEDEFWDAPTKASYAMLYAHEWSTGDAHIHILTDVIKAQTGCTEVIYAYDDGTPEKDEYPWGYIDHQSAEDGRLDYLFADTETLRLFIFNPDSMLRTDNDNH